MKGRIAWIDAAKCVGIFAIVLGHIFTGGVVKKAVYSFHVPLFFFLSGLVAHYDDKSLRSVLRDRARKLLLPYYCFGLLSLAILTVIGKAAFGTLADWLDYTFGESLWLTMIGFSVANRPLWFLPCLFVSDIALYFCTELERKAGHKWILRGTVIAVCLIATAIYTRLGAVTIPFHLDKAVAMFPFLYGGYCVRELPRDSGIVIRKKPLRLLLSLLSLALGLYIGIQWNGFAQYIELMLWNPSLFFLSAALSIGGICGICMQLPKLRVLQAVGRNTMPILLMHKFPVVFFQTLCPYVKDRVKADSVIWCVLVCVVSVALCYIAGAILRKLCPPVIGEKRSVIQPVG